jgi:hypothetical protein
MVRVLTYSPQYIGAREPGRLADGVTILLWNDVEKRWCEDSGESPLFSPTHWRPLPGVELSSSDRERLGIQSAADKVSPPQPAPTP